MRLCFLFFLTALFAGPAMCQPTGFTWSGVLRYDPYEAIPTGTLGGFFSDLYGAEGQTGQVAISGGVQFETAHRAVVSNQVYAAYRDVISDMRITLAGVEITADFNRIRPYAASGEFFGHVHSDGGFCSSVFGCERWGMTNYPSGWPSVMTIVNDSRFYTSNERDTEEYTGDGISFAAGGTDVVADFVPTITTQSHGIVAIDGVAITIGSLPNQHFFYGLNLPDMRIFIGTTSIEKAEVSVRFELPGLNDPVTVEGIITNFEILP